MSIAVAEDRRSRSVPDWHQDFLRYVVPAVQSFARSRLRNLAAVEQEEATAEAIAGAMIAFVRLIRRGKNPIAFVGRLAKIAVLRVMTGRLTGARARCQDVLSRFARQQHGYSVESLDAPLNPNATAWKTLLVEDRKSTPADIAASRIDFAEWLGRMSNRRREIAEALAAGYRTEEVANRFRLSDGRISQLRREFESSWREFQSDSPRHGARCPAAA
jgi:hypothetical protein